MAKITFVNRDGSETVVEGRDGLSVMEVAIDNDVDIDDLLKIVSDDFKLSAVISPSKFFFDNLF